MTSKLGALVILRGLLSMPIDLTAIPDPSTPYDPEMDSIVDTSEVPGAGDVSIEMCL